MPARRTSLVLLACAALAGCGGGNGDPAAGGVTSYGINAQNVRVLADAGRSEELEPHARALGELGVDFARANLDWQALEPAPGHYDFSATDAWVEALARNGLRWQPTMMGVPTPAWARDPAAIAAGCDYRSPPDRPSYLARMGAALARRYGRGGSFWREHAELDPQPAIQFEVWNEPNFGNFWCPAPDPTAYGRLYAATHRAIHAVDPATEVVFGGLAAFRQSVSGPQAQMAVELFLERALAAMPELGREVDALGVHAYGPTAEDVLFTLTWFRQVADAAGLADVPLSVNEFGWRTRGAGPSPPLSEAERAEAVAAVARAIPVSGCGVEALALHTWITPELNAADGEHWFGVADPATGDPYPTARAYADAAAGEDGEAVAVSCG